MEEHPIPQNVTQFEFHLVGDMTLKQFGYLAAGLGLGYATFMVLSTKAPFIAWPMIVIFVLFGVAFAFLPISERPLDHWLKAYINAVFSPTQMVFKSSGLALDNPYYRDRLALYLDMLPVSPEPVKPLPKASALSQMAPATQNITTPLSNVSPIASSSHPEPVRMPTYKPEPVRPKSVEPTQKPIETVAPTPKPVAPIAPTPKPVESKPVETTSSAPVPEPVQKPQPIVVDQVSIQTIAREPIGQLQPEPITSSLVGQESAVQSTPPTPIDTQQPVRQQVIQAREVAFETSASNPPVSTLEPTSTPGAAAPQTLTVQPASIEPIKNIKSEQTPAADTNLNKVVEYAKEAQIIQAEIIETEKQLDDIKTRAAQPGNNPQEFSEKFKKVMDNLAHLNAQAEQVSKILAKLTQTQENKPDVHVKVVDVKPANDEKFLVLTTTPNIINGIVTDSVNNYLEGVIVVTHDKDDLPVRALKTNKLGQFLAATPLPNGTYTLTFEKDNLNFDVLQVTLDGTLLPPIKVTAKAGGGLS